MIETAVSSASLYMAGNVFQHTFELMPINGASILATPPLTGSSLLSLTAVRGRCSGSRAQAANHDDGSPRQPTLILAGWLDISV